MSYKAYNDYELLYLATQYQDSVALDIIISKYSSFIYKKALSFFPYDENVDDYYQEGLISLYRCIQSFDEQFNKTFMRYFEVVLEKSFINIYYRKKREKENIAKIINEFKVQKDYLVIEEETFVSPGFQFKAPIEQCVYDLYFVKGENVDLIAEQLKKTKKQVYNTIYRVKQKLKEIIKD